MKTRIILVIAVTLLALASLALADGVFVPKIDPRSHAEDISEPDQKALIAYAGGTEVMVLQVSYRGSASEFAWLVPTPGVPEVKPAYEATFHELHTLTAPELRFWFDADKAFDFSKGRRSKLASQGVEVVEEKTVGAYDIAVLRAGRAEELIGWLKRHGYKVDSRLAPVVEGYLGRGWVFTGMRINAASRDKSTKRLNEGALQSLLFKFKTPEPVFPLKISSLNPGRTAITIYTLMPYRTEAEGLETVCATYHSGSSTPFYFRTLRVLHRDDALQGMPRQVITKLRGSFTSREMTQDVIFRRSADQTMFAAGPRSAPLVANIGAVSVLGIKLASFGWLYWFIGFFIFSTTATWRRMDPRRQSAIRYWVIGATIAAFAVAFGFGKAASAETYEVVGWVVLVGLGVILGMTVHRVAKGHGWVAGGRNPRDGGRRTDSADNACSNL